MFGKTLEGSAASPLAKGYGGTGCVEKLPSAFAEATAGHDVWKKGADIGLLARVVFVEYCGLQGGGRSVYCGAQIEKKKK